MNVRSLLDVRDLSIQAGRRWVVRSLTFRASAGTPVWVIGENGAGKSSLLRALALRGTGRGTVLHSPVPDMNDIAYYSPLMGAPPRLTVRHWLEFNERLLEGVAGLLAHDDSLVPLVKLGARLDRLSTGETKRFLLWSLLRLGRPFTILDEPYEHLSPTARDRLTEILIARAGDGVVVVATNQNVPDIRDKQVVELM